MTNLSGKGYILRVAYLVATCLLLIAGSVRAGVVQRSIGTGAVAHAIGTHQDTRGIGDESYSQAELQGAGCVAVGGTGTLIAYMINTNEYLMIAAGGTLASSSPAVVALALLSTVAASGCAIGAIATPVMMRWYHDAQSYWQSEPATGDKSLPTP